MTPAAQDGEGNVGSTPKRSRTEDRNREMRVPPVRARDPHFSVRIYRRRKYQKESLSGRAYFDAYRRSFSPNAASSAFTARRCSWNFMSRLERSRSPPAIFEQWSDTRSRSVRRSDHTKPASMVHSPCWRREMWEARICSLRTSITCSRGDTEDTASGSPFTKAL